MLKNLTSKTTHPTLVGEEEEDDDADVEEEPRECTARQPTSKKEPPDDLDSEVPRQPLCEDMDVEMGHNGHPEASSSGLDMTFDDDINKDDNTEQGDSPGETVQPRPPESPTAVDIEQDNPVPNKPDNPEEPSE